MRRLRPLLGRRVAGQTAADIPAKRRLRSLLGLPQGSCGSRDCQHGEARSAVNADRLASGRRERRQGRYSEPLRDSTLRRGLAGRPEAQPRVQEAEPALSAQANALPEEAVRVRRTDLAPPRGSLLSTPERQEGWARDRAKVRSPSPTAPLRTPQSGSYSGTAGAREAPGARPAEEGLRSMVEMTASVPEAVRPMPVAILPSRCGWP